MWSRSHRPPPALLCREETIYDPLHYLALLEQKSNALEQAAPLQKWELPAAFGQLRHLLEVRQTKGARREYIQVLRLLECFSFETVAWAVEEALRLQAISFDAVSTWYCAALNADRRDWISRSILICPPLWSPQQPPQST